MTTAPNLHSPSLPIFAIARPDGYAQEFVQTMRHGSLSSKIAAVALPLITTLAVGVAIGTVVGSPLLTCFILVLSVTPPALALIIDAWETLSSKEGKTVAEIKQAFSPVQEAVGGKEAFDKLPIVKCDGS